MLLYDVGFVCVLCKLYVAQCHSLTHVFLSRPNRLAGQISHLFFDRGTLLPWRSVIRDRGRVCQGAASACFGESNVRPDCLPTGSHNAPKFVIMRKLGALQGVFILLGTLVWSTPLSADFIRSTVTTVMTVAATNACSR